MTTTAQVPPAVFIWRRVHSLMGLWLVLFLIEHLLTNSQAALLFGQESQGFVRLVNLLHNMPSLQILEVALIGIPILIHLVWGIGYCLEARFNSLPLMRRFPSLPKYGRNQGFTWMRLTAVIIGVGVVAHVIQFRFVRYPIALHRGKESLYFSKLGKDEKLPLLAQTLGVQIYDLEQVRQVQKEGEGGAFARALTKRTLGDGHVIAVSPDFGTAALLNVRDVFKSPLYVALYSIFVLATCFHAGHGFWTFLITWGVILKQTAQDRLYPVALAVGALLAALGLIAIWGTFWVTSYG